jgi:hypothetical protein
MIPTTSADDHGHRDLVEQPVASEEADGVGEAEQRVPLDDHQDDAAEGDPGRQGGDEVGHLQPRDQQPVDGAHEHADAERREDRQQVRERGELHQPRHGERGGARHRAHREIDAAAGDHEGHADRQHHEHGGLDQDVAHVDDRQPVVAHEDHEHRRRGCRSTARTG